MFEVSIFINGKMYAFSCVLAVSMYGCATPPDSSRHENGWTVIENKCEDLLVEVRTKVDYGSGEANRWLQLSDLQNRKIYKVEIGFNSSGSTSINSTSYENNAENKISEAKKLPAAININAALNEAYDNFYEEQGKHESIDLKCVLRGMHYGT